MTDVIIQARSGSTRLPNKVLMSLYGKTILTHMVERINQSTEVDRIIIAIPDTPSNNDLAQHASELTDYVYRGSEANVLDRYYQAALFYKSSNIVRICSDCPLIDAGLLTNLIKAFYLHKPDYASNVIEPHIPYGLGSEIFSFQTLEKAWSQANSQHQKEHVTPYIYQNPDEFNIYSHLETNNYPTWRLSLDTQEDFNIISEIYSHLYEEKQFFNFNDIEELLLKTPHLLELVQD